MSEGEYHPENSERGELQKPVRGIRMGHFNNEEVSLMASVLGGEYVTQVTDLTGLVREGIPFENPLKLPGIRGEMSQRVDTQKRLSYFDLTIHDEDHPTTLSLTEAAVADIDPAKGAVTVLDLIGMRNVRQFNGEVSDGEFEANVLTLTPDGYTSAVKTGKLATFSPEEQMLLLKRCENEYRPWAKPRAEAWEVTTTPKPQQEQEMSAEGMISLAKQLTNKQTQVAVDLLGGVIEPGEIPGSYGSYYEPKGISGALIKLPEIKSTITYDDGGNLGDKAVRFSMWNGRAKNSFSLGENPAVHIDRMNGSVSFIDPLQSGEYENYSSSADAAYILTVTDKSFSYSLKTGEDLSGKEREAIALVRAEEQKRGERSS